MRARLRRWLFVGSFLLAILAGLDQLKGDWAIWVLSILGLAVGFLNVSKLEIGGFLISAIALQLSAGAVEVIPEVGELITNVLGNIVIFTSAILLLVAVKEIFFERDMRNYGLWAMIVGVIVAILTAFGIFSGTWPFWVLAAIGIGVGVLDLTNPEIDRTKLGGFVVAAIALLLSANAFNNVPIIGEYLTSFFTNIVVLISATMLVVALVATFQSLEGVE